MTGQGCLKRTHPSALQNLRTLDDAAHVLEGIVEHCAVDKERIEAGYELVYKYRDASQMQERSPPRWNACKSTEVAASCARRTCNQEVQNEEIAHDDVCDVKDCLKTRDEHAG